MDADLLGSLLLGQALSFPHRAKPAAKMRPFAKDGLLQRRTAPYFGAAVSMPGNGARHPIELREGTLKLHNLQVTLRK
jgi:hypothetical protein